MSTSAAYRRRCTACGATALEVATRCPRCSDAMPNRDDRGQLLKFWGCRGCHTLNTPTDLNCQHCAAPREAAASPRRVMLGVVSLAAAAAIVIVGVTQWPTSHPVATVATQKPTAITAPTTAPVVSTPPPTIAVSEVVRSAPPQTDVPPSTALVSIKWVNVRTAPMPGAAILGVIKPQTSVVVLASQDGWVRVKSDALTGWVYGQGVTERQ